MKARKVREYGANKWRERDVINGEKRDGKEIQNK